MPQYGFLFRIPQVPQRPTISAVLRTTASKSLHRGEIALSLPAASSPDAPFLPGRSAPNGSSVCTCRHLQLASAWVSPVSSSSAVGSAPTVGGLILCGMTSRMGSDVEPLPTLRDSGRHQSRRDRARSKHLHNFMIHFCSVQNTEERTGQSSVGLITWKRLCPVQWIHWNHDKCAQDVDALFLGPRTRVGGIAHKGQQEKACCLGIRTRQTLCKVAHVSSHKREGSRCLYSDLWYPGLKRPESGADLVRDVFLDRNKSAE